jgi:hypothetical protein
MSDNNSPLWLWCLIIAAEGLRRNDQTPKSVTASSAQRSWFKANNGINGRGPPQAGRMPFMPAVSLNQWSGALPKRGSCFPGKVFLRFASSFFCFRLFRQFNLLALSTSAVRTRAISLVLGLSFYPLEQAPNMMIYAMSKSGTATSGLILVCGSCSPKRQLQTRAVAAKKFICGLASLNFSARIPCFF